jgi:hypothetical protein
MTNCMRSPGLPRYSATFFYVNTRVPVEDCVPVDCVPVETVPVGAVCKLRGGLQLDRG